MDTGTYFLVGGVVVLAALGVLGGIGQVAAYLDSPRRQMHLHLGGRCKNVDITTQPVRDWERINFHLALDRLRKEAGTDLVAHAEGRGAALAGLLAHNNRRQGVQTTRLPRGFEQTLDVPENVVYLIRHEGEPACALLAHYGGNDLDMPAASTTMTLEVLARAPEVAKAALERVVRLAREQSVYKGKTITLTEAPYGGNFFKIEFQDVPPVAREEIVLPEEVMKVVERNVLGFLAHAEALRRAGRSTRHGVLFHGPPGVGKTLVTRYLTRACKDYTVILLTGKGLRFIRESMLLARLLAPSMVVFEDVDLVAQERETNRFGGVLQELLEALDGLGRKTDCILILTTNRPDLLEPALANRPGRVDQAIYFDLPDAECRRRLLELYGKGLDLSAADLPGWVDRTDGVSPAFLAEWLRKAALLAAERGERSVPLRVTEADLDGAFRELVLFGGSVTQNLLGFRPTGKPG